jgi:hypothetical protein
MLANLVPVLKKVWGIIEIKPSVCVAGRAQPGWPGEDVYTFPH